MSTQNKLLNLLSNVVAKMLYVSPDRKIKCIIFTSVSVVFTMLHASHSQLLPDTEVYFSFIIF